jgi:hypothetical protein
MIEILMQNYVWIMIVIALVLFACIGYLVDKKEQETKEKKERQKNIEKEEMATSIVEAPVSEQPVEEISNIASVPSEETSNESMKTSEESKPLEEKQEEPSTLEEPANDVSEVEEVPEIEANTDKGVEDSKLEEVVPEETPFEPIDEQFDDIVELESFGPLDETESENPVEEVQTVETKESDETEESKPLEEKQEELSTLEEPANDIPEIEEVPEIETNLDKAVEDFPLEEEIPQETQPEEISNIFETNVEEPTHSELTDDSANLSLDNDTTIDHDFENLLNDEILEEIPKDIKEVEETKKEDFKALDDDDEDLWKF